MTRSPLLAALALPLALSAQGGDPTPAVALRAARVYTVSGETIEGGTVVCRDGKVESVAKGARTPRGVRALEGFAVTPGLIDANSTAGVAGAGVEASSEVTPRVRAIDAVDPNAKAFERLARAGVTTVFVTPDTGNVIAGLGAIVKTAGDDLAARVVNPGAALKAAMGADPSRGNIPVRFGTPTTFYYRRPTTRMGVVWIFRKAFFDALDYQARWTEYRTRGATSSVEPASPASGAPERDPDLDLLVETLEGRLPLRITARRATDIRTALRLTEEFGLRPTIDEALEGYRVADELRSRGVAVVAGPIEFAPTSFGRRVETDEPCLGNAALLDRAGVLVALTANDRSGDEALPGQATFAIRYGMPFEAALRAVTLHPARVLGVEGRLGSIEPGKDADLVLWSGEPFAPGSRPLAVLVDGRVVYDAAEDPALAPAAPTPASEMKR